MIALDVLATVFIAAGCVFFTAGTVGIWRFGDLASRLLYDLGNLYATTGEVDKARKTFVEIYGINSNYRDVVARLEELGE